jgi:hypothetical protein
MNGTRGVAGPKQDEDLRRNPGIGQSKGSFATGEDPELLEGENSAEGDVDNDANAQGGIDENQKVRANE